MLFVFMSSILQAQEMAYQLPYQAVLRAEGGQPLADTQIEVLIKLITQDEVSASFYTEKHQVKTNQQGYFSIDIGSGEVINGVWEKAPWATENLWLETTYSITGQDKKYLISRNEMMAVPYAFVAGSTNRIDKGKDVGLRENFSIHWNTAGNYKTVPHVHFVGTRDDRDFFLKTNDETRIVIEAAGRVTIYSDYDDNSGNKGNDEYSSTYAYVLEGNQHGIYIEANTNQRSLDNNYLTFADIDDIHGTIEGQTLKQLMGSFDYIYTNILNAVNFVLGAAVTGSEFAQSVGFATAAGTAGASIFLAWKSPGYGVASGGTAGLGAAGAADLIKSYAEAAEFLITSHKNAGVTYTSGGADYAEYIKRAVGERDMEPGEVVGILNGELTLDTDKADHYMVISGRPVVLGNMPSPEREELFEKVAFLGQAFVNVSGEVNYGDYILPSGNHDGLAIAIHPQEIETVQMSKIIGVSMEAVNGEAGEIHLVNTSIGLSKNALASKTESLEKKVDHILAYLEGKVEHPDLKVNASNQQKEEGQTEELLTNKELEDIFRNLLEDQRLLVETYFTTLEIKMQEQGINLREVPVWGEILDNPTEAIMNLRNHPILKDKWKYVDQQIIETIKPTKIGDE